MLKFGLLHQDWNVLPIETSRTKFAAVNCEGQVLLLGGKKQGVRSADCEILDEGKQCLQPCFKLQGVRSGHGAVFLKGVVLVVGGNNGEAILNSCEAYNVRTGAFRKMADMKERRDELAVVVGRDGRVYAIGGCGEGSRCLNTVECYDPDKNEWRLTSHLNTARRALGAACLADGIYAIGGFDGHSYLNSVERYDEGAKRWVQISSMSHARCTHAVVAAQDSQTLFVFGGFDNRALGSVEKYDALTGGWEFVGEMPEKLFMHSAVLQG